MDKLPAVGYWNSIFITLVSLMFWESAYAELGVLSVSRVGETGMTMQRGAERGFVGRQRLQIRAFSVQNDRPTVPFQSFHVVFQRDRLSETDSFQKAREDFVHSFFLVTGSRSLVRSEMTLGAAPFLSEVLPMGPASGRKWLIPFRDTQQVSLEFLIQQQLQGRMTQYPIVSGVAVHIQADRVVLLPPLQDQKAVTFGASAEKAVLAISEDPEAKILPSLEFWMDHAWQLESEEVAAFLAWAEVYLELTGVDYRHRFEVLRHRNAIGVGLANVDCSSSLSPPKMTNQFTF